MNCPEKRNARSSFFDRALIAQKESRKGCAINAISLNAKAIAHCCARDQAFCIAHLAVIDRADLPLTLSGGLLF
jgi:hypothetical protein